MTTKKIKTSDILGDNYYIYELTSSNYTPALNGTVTITCTMKDVYGAVASSKSITLYQNGTSKGAKTTNSSGVATWSITCSTAGLQKFNIKDTSIEVFVDNKSNVDHTHSGYAAASALNTLSDTVNGLGQAIDELADVAETGDYDDLINAPTNISAFNNDVGYLTSHQSLNSKTVTVEKLATAESGYLSSYAVKQNGVQVGNTINIPKDFLVKSGSVKTVSTANSPVTGYSVGDKYIDLIINTKDSSGTDEHIYILVSDLVTSSIAISDVTNLQTTLNGKIDTAGTGLSKNGTTLNHSNSVTAVTTAAFKKIKYDAQGHITGTANVSASDLPSHTHGNLTNDGKVGSAANYFVYTTTSGAITSKQKIGNITTSGAIGSTANLPVITTSSGVLTTGSFGTSANTFCQGNDSRLSDARTPTAHTHSSLDVQSPTRPWSNIGDDLPDDTRQDDINIAIDNVLTLKEDKGNKVTSLSSSNTDTEYPSAKSVYDYINNKLTWKKLTLTNMSGFTLYYNDYFCHLKMERSGTLPTAGSYTALVSGTIPEGYRPAVMTTIPADGTATIRVKVTASGIIQYYTEKAVTSSATIRGTWTWARNLPS